MNKTDLVGYITGLQSMITFMTTQSISDVPAPILAAEHDRAMDEFIELLSNEKTSKENQDEH